MMWMMNRRICPTTLLLLLVAASLIPTSVVVAQQDEKEEEEQKGANKIVGGTPAGANEFNFFGHSSPQYRCGSALIHPQIIMTAAHCECGFTDPAIVSEIFLGSNELLNRDASLDDVPIAAGGLRVIHPNYSDSGILRNDILIVKLSRPSTITPVPWATTVPADGATTTAVGFGATDFNDNTPNPILLKVDVPVVSFNTCNSANYYNGGIDRTSMLCAGAQGRDSCAGTLDSAKDVSAVIGRGSGYPGIGPRCNRSSRTCTNCSRRAHLTLLIRFVVAVAGDSGGPLLNRQRQVVGITSAGAGTFSSCNH
jgi:secreted trypsin-like serine protease